MHSGTSEIPRTEDCTVNEEEFRRAVWENMRMIQLLNGEYSNGKHGFTMEMNAFGDMTNEESRQVANGYQHQKHKKGRIFQETMMLKIPKTVDCREKVCMTPVKNLGQCGSCWVFSTSGCLEGQMCLKTGKLVSPSVENLGDCSHPQGNQGYTGGLLDFAFHYIKENEGLGSEDVYPYEAKDGSCKYRAEYAVANDMGFMDIPHQEKALVKAVAMTVWSISTAMDASHPSLQFYSSGIYYEPNCSSKDLDHSKVLVVGYEFEGTGSNKSKYWLVKNS